MSSEQHATPGPPGGHRPPPPEGRRTPPGDPRPRTGGRRRAPHALLYSTLRLIARHVPGFWAAMAVFLVIGLFLAALATVLLVAVAGAIETGAMQRFDERALVWLAERRTPFLDDVMIHVTALGDGLVLVMLVGVVSVFLWLTRHRWSVYVLLAGMFGGQVMNTLLKEVFARPRPDVIEALARVTTKSFPSGHAMSAFIGYGSIAYIIARLEPTAALRRTTWAIAVLTILAVGFSRMYLGVHYPSDVLAGFMAGLAWLGFVAAGVVAVRFFAPRRPATADEEHGLDAPDPTPRP
jgi:undecaprenyl-diphosphatase